MAKTKSKKSSEPQPPSLPTSEDWQKANLKAGLKSTDTKTVLIEMLKDPQTVGRSQIVVMREAAAIASKNRNDILSGRTVEGGTRSMLEGVRGFMRGGGTLKPTK
jgi:hypothetical protein